MCPLIGASLKLRYGVVLAIESVKNLKNSKQMTAFFILLHKISLGSPVWFPWNSLYRLSAESGL